MAVGVAVFPIGARDFEVTLLRYSTLLDVADVVSLRHKPGELFRDLVPGRRAALPWEFINFAIHDPFLKTIKLYLACGGEQGPNLPEKIAVEDSSAGWVWRNQQVLCPDDVELVERFERGLRRLEISGSRPRSAKVKPPELQERISHFLGVRFGSLRRSCARSKGEESYHAD